MPASGPRSRGPRVHPRSCQGCRPWPRASAASGLVLATQKLGGITGRASAPSSNTCRLLARDHAAPESTLALARAASLGRERVRPLAWCSRTRNSAALLDEALAETGLEEEDDQRPAHVEGHQHREDHPGSDHRAARMPDVLADVAVADERACRCWAALLIGLLRGHQKTFSITSVG